MENQLICIDSRFRDASGYPNAGKFLYKLDEPIRNVDYVRLSSIELPNIHYTFTAAKNNVTFKLLVGENTYEVGIMEGSYNSDLFLNYIHEQLNRINALFNQNFAITFNEITSKITIRNSVQFGMEFGVKGQYPTLGYHMGYRKSSYSGALSYTAESVLDVIGDQYVYLRINDYGVLYNRVASKRILAKIIIDKNKTFIVYDNESNTLSKNYRFRQPVNIDRFEIEILDPYGNVVDLVGQDFSLTLEVGWIQHSHLKNTLESRFHMN